MNRKMKGKRVLDERTTNNTKTNTNKRELVHE
jgi:hypothetical protein